MNKRVKLTGLFVGLLVVFFGICYFLYLNHYVCRLSINGTKLGFVKYTELDKYVYSVMTETDYVFDNLDLDTDSVTYSFETNDKFQDYSFKNFMLGLIGGSDYQFVILKQIDSNKVISWLNNYNKDQKSSTSAYIDKTDKFEIVPEIIGTEIDVNAIVAELTPYKYNHIVLSDYILAPDVVTSDLEEICASANNYATWSCMYTNGTIIKSDIDKVWLDDTYGIVYDDSFIEEEVASCTDSYNGKPEFISFHTTSGKDINVPNATLEAKVDVESEIAYLKQAMKECKILEDRVPCFLMDNSELGNTYVEVSIPEQHMWYYLDGECVLESAVVTGQVGVHDTPTGCFYITQMINGTYLTGEDYKEWVNRWMRLTTNGIGIHDANWRSTFGGDIYLTDGSHGCVNMPNLKAADLYELVDIGTVVIIHD